jgi:hypothetical protein
VCQSVDRTFGERSVARVEVERGERRLLQMEGDRARAAGGRLGVAGQAVGDQQVQAPALVLGQALVGHVAHHPMAEAPDVGAIAVAFE